MRSPPSISTSLIAITLAACLHGTSLGADSPAPEQPATAGAVAAAEPVADPASSLGRPIGDFTLRDPRGVEHSLAELKDSQLVVVAFLGRPHRPLLTEHTATQ